MSGSHKTRWCSCSCSCSKKMVKYGRRPLPDLNYPPPPDSDEESSPSHPNYDKLHLQGIAHENSSAVASRKRKMEERESESESESSSSHRIKVFWNMLMNYIIPNPNKKKKVETAH
ncbi:uncharacterized protein LOC114167288 isoform X1 [Vigna unguiculata]|uniref:uncharacterized protein LOC114167288 isoform X1 n=1 Tax=Vigna unguiculata TaxID=3917 RepID=UPI001016070E|nr:uncharacterized protein LOC114167288 isoform X1 [Vigna unguiculata]